MSGPANPHGCGGRSGPKWPAIPHPEPPLPVCSKPQPFFGALLAMRGLALGALAQSAARAAKAGQESFDLNQRSGSAGTHAIADAPGIISLEGSEAAKPQPAVGG